MTPLKTTPEERAALRNIIERGAKPARADVANALDDLDTLAAALSRAESNLSYASVCESERVAREALSAGARELTHEAALRVAAERDTLAAEVGRLRALLERVAKLPIAHEGCREGLRASLTGRFDPAKCDCKNGKVIKAVMAALETP